MPVASHRSYRAADGPLAGEKYALTDNNFIDDGGAYRANVAIPTGDGRTAMYRRTTRDYDPTTSSTGAA